MASKKVISVKDAIAKADQMKKKSSLSWYDRLDARKKKWCDELKKEYQSGSCSHVAINSLRIVVNENMSLSIREQPFRFWIKGKIRTKGKTHESSKRSR